ncbi:MAG: methylated-DNA--[protein]-cysteine S-methyltransferase [Holdemanella sp.]|nr:methylated-DNA--[protein]-cysteine S-methyltransferase [Holdemanella sp.]
MKTYYTYTTRIGPITIAEEDGMIVSIDTDQKVDGIEKRNELLDCTYKQLEEYFQGKRKTFDIPYKLKGTPFQLSVWHYLETIPYGKTCSYQDVAIGIGNPKSCRAVGMACHRNPIPFIVPCHRVIGKNRKMVGFGLGIDLKIKLLDIERGIYD